MQDPRVKRIGILGGTFNPVHMGHMILAQSAVEALDLSKIMFIPCGVPPHKDPGLLIGAEHRLAMVQAAIAGDPRFEALDIEIRRPGISYAVDTVAQLREQHPGTELVFVLGSDTLSELHLWKNVYSLMTLCRFAVFCRQGFDVSTMQPASLRIESPWAERLAEGVIVGRQIDISSSDIRYRVAEGMSIRYLIPPAVERYIEEHALYG
jgi:nicotinate-nucleotide adenylyltransferase